MSIVRQCVYTVLWWCLNLHFVAHLASFMVSHLGGISVLLADGSK